MPEEREERLADIQTYHQLIHVSLKTAVRACVPNECINCGSNIVLYTRVSLLTHLKGAGWSVSKQDIHIYAEAGLTGTF